MITASPAAALRVDNISNLEKATQMHREFGIVHLRDTDRAVF